MEIIVVNHHSGTVRCSGYDSCGGLAESIEADHLNGTGKYSCRNIDFITASSDEGCSVSVLESQMVIYFAIEQRVVINQRV